MRDVGGQRCKAEAEAPAGLGDVKGAGLVKTEAGPLPHRPPETGTEPERQTLTAGPGPGQAEDCSQQTKLEAG